MTDWKVWYLYNVVFDRQENHALKKVVSEKSDHLNEANARIKDLETKNSEILVLQNTIKEMKIEMTTTEDLNKEMTSKNHELSKLLQKMQESITRKEQVRYCFFNIYSRNAFASF